MRLFGAPQAADAPPVQAVELAPEAEPAPVLPPCEVAPLPAIEDPSAQRFEAAVGSAGVVDVDGMTAPAERALARFEQAVERAGGAIELKSAYRPQSYQQHLEQVWDKWMIELRSNTEPGCQDLRAQAGEEFARHHLIETQRPVPVSDHTRGIAFDALVTLPAGARWKRRRVNVDYLARISGVGRPAIASDPVHFRLLGGRKSRSA